MKKIWDFIKWLFGFAREDLKKLVASGLNVGTARALVRSYLESRRSALVEKARGAIKHAAEEGRTQVIMELKALDDHAAGVLRNHGFTVSVDEEGGKWVITW